MKNKCGILLRLLIVIIFCIGSIVGLSACSGNKGNEDIDPPNQEIPSDPSLDTIFDSDGTGADTNGLTYQKFISRSKKYKIAWITGYNGSDYADVVIPETVDTGYTVTKIEEKAFENSNISSVAIPSQLEEIGSYAFRNCQFLQEIDLGEVVSIENHAFNKCILLKTVTIPNTCLYLGNSAFADCISLENVSLSYSLTELNNFAFSGCTALKTVEVPSSVVAVGENVFYNCESLESVTLPSSVESVGGSLFSGCISLKSITINGKWKKIPESFCEGCNSLSEIQIPEGIESIGQKAFANCASLKSVVTPTSLQVIYAEAFDQCDNLENVVLQEGLTAIYHDAFGSNYGSYSPGFMERHLTSIIIPSTVVRIDSGAFCMGRSYINTQTNEISYDDNVYIFNNPGTWIQRETYIYCVASDKPTAWSNDWTNWPNSNIKWGYQLEGNQ